MHVGRVEFKAQRATADARTPSCAVKNLNELTQTFNDMAAS
jgi:hypothetical protein